MTKKEISELFDIPLSTINDWQKESSSRHKLYKFLRAIPKKEYQSIKSQQKNHRLMHILNRNINKRDTYSVKDIQKAFSKQHYDEATLFEKVIYNKFFKECDSDDLESLVTLYDLSIRNIKKIYLSSPLRKLEGVRKVWDKRFRIRSNDYFPYSEEKNKIPAALSQILEKRE